MKSFHPLDLTISKNDHPGEQVGQPRSRDRRPLDHTQESGVVVGEQRYHRGLVR